MKLLSLAFLAFSFISSGYSQDKIYTTSNEVIKCKIQREDSLSYYIKIRKQGEYYNTFISKSNVDSIKNNNQTVKSRNQTIKTKVPPKYKERDVVLHCDILLPEVALEFNMGFDFTLLVGYQPGFIWRKPNGQPSQFYNVHQISSAFRKYINFEERTNQNKNINKFSGNFVSIRTVFGLESEVTPSFNVTGLTYGLQRNFNQVFHFSFDLGLGYLISDTYLNEITFMGDLKLGFIF